MTNDWNAGGLLVALDEHEMRAAGGAGPWLVAIVSGVLVAVVNSADEFIEGVKDGYEWARAD